MRDYQRTSINVDSSMIVALSIYVQPNCALLLLRQLGLWRRLRAAPISNSVLPSNRVPLCSLAALIRTAIIVTVAIALFEVRIRGMHAQVHRRSPRLLAADRKPGMADCRGR